MRDETFPEPGLDQAKENLLRELRTLGIADPRVLEAMARVPRHRFVPPYLLPYAYEDHPLPIGHDQTISQPYIVALSTAALALAPSDRVLEIGTGSGYQTAVLAELAREVCTVERLPELSRSAQERLAALGYANIRFHVGDGTKGWPEQAPFEAILVTAGAPRVPEGLLAQLAPGGRMVIPVGGRFNQELLFIEENRGRFVTRKLCPCTFVPLIGEEGWT
ncbi:MAG: protein-L-isoaspartate(D-aspartate) O-methyltransferase [Candidatus Bipolaricaulota bacterium]